jgi:hypothetical protein
MDYDPDRDPAAPLESDSNAKHDKPSFQEIMRHAWPILWENPASLLLFVLGLVILQVAMDYISNSLLAPFLPFFEEFFAKGDTGTEARDAFNSLLDEHGRLRFFGAAFLPLLFVPFVSYAMSRGALSIWDGFSPSFQDYLYALLGYFKALLITLCLTVLFFALILASFFVFVPALLLIRVLPQFFLLHIAFFLFSAYLWFRLVWPLVRRFFFLQFFVFFNMSDHPGMPGFTRQLLQISEDLKLWPSHLNAMVGIAFLLLIGVTVPTQFLILILENVLPFPAISFISHSIMIIAFLWLITAMAGFYRLCLYPKDEIPPADYGRVW